MPVNIFRFVQIFLPQLNFCVPGADDGAAAARVPALVCDDLEVGEPGVLVGLRLPAPHHPLHHGDLRGRWDDEFITSQFHNLLSSCSKVFKVFIHYLVSRKYDLKDDRDESENGEYRRRHHPDLLVCLSLHQHQGLRCNDPSTEHCSFVKCQHCQHS